MVGSSGRQRVQNAAFNNFFLTLPDNKLLFEFDKQTAPLFQKMTKLNNEVKSLGNLRDTLLPKLISGEVRVSEEMMERVGGLAK